MNLSSLSSWFSAPTKPQSGDADESRNADEVKSENTTSAPENSQQIFGFDKPDVHDISSKAVTSAKQWGSYLAGFATTASKAVVDTIEDKTIIGDFSREQSKFAETQSQQKHTEAALPPWLGYQEEEQMKEQIMLLSGDERNFLRNPPAGVDFSFNLESSFPVAMVMLKEDERLSKLRFKLVPKQISEAQFWCNYFYRLSLVQQSSQLTSLAVSQEGEEPVATPPRTPPRPIQTHQESPLEDTELPPESPDFASDSLHLANESRPTDEEMDSERKKLGMNKNREGSDEQPEEWEKELQEELREFEMVAEGDDNGEWEEELNQMLDDEEINS